MLISVYSCFLDNPPILDVSVTAEAELKCKGRNEGRLELHEREWEVATKEGHIQGWTLGQRASHTSYSLLHEEIALTSSFAIECTLGIHDTQGPLGHSCLALALCDDQQ